MLEQSTEEKSLMNRLRDETAEFHQAVEAKLPFGEEDFSLAVYRRLLIGFYNFYRQFEPEIENALRRLAIDFDYEARRKKTKILADLENLNAASEVLAEKSDIDAENDAEIGVKLDSGGKIFGALYVIEGSTLGGQVIARILKQKFNLDESNGAAFFSGYGARTGEMWKEFRTAIHAFAENGADQEQIIAAAKETFESFGRAIRPN